MATALELPIRKIISGAQTGVDRAALNVAIRLGLPCGGWCPRGRFAEDGVISHAYLLKETPHTNYAERTEWNVRDSDGTLIICKGAPTGGTAYTIGMCKKHVKPVMVVDLTTKLTLIPVQEWLRIHRVMTLNVAGPRESTSPGIGEETEHLLDTLLMGEF